MVRKATESTNSKTTSRSPKTAKKTKQAPKKIQTENVLKSDCNKTIALQEALQDPITIYEGN